MTLWAKIIIAHRKMEYGEIIIANNWIKDGTIVVRRLFEFCHFVGHLPLVILYFVFDNRYTWASLISAPNV